MTDTRRAGAVAVALWLCAPAVAPAQVAHVAMSSLDELDPLPLVGFVLTPGITPTNLAENIEGFTRDLLEMGDYDHKIRAKGMTAKREETLAMAESSFGVDKEVMLMELAWLQDAVERAPLPGTGLKEDGVEYDFIEKLRPQLLKRKPRATDFVRAKRRLREYEQSDDAVLKPGELEFKSPTP